MKINLLGQRFGRLTVISESEARSLHRAWLCVCDCGETTVALQSNLRRGHTQSCGCLASELGSTHGASKTPEYRAYINMMSRCYNPKTPLFNRYGGRGISVCAKWRVSFESFAADMGPRPSPKHSLDRVDCNGNYEPGNCRWATQKQQCRNLTNNRIVEFAGEKMTLAEAVEKLGVKYTTVLSRLRRGKSEAESLR